MRMCMRKYIYLISIFSNTMAVDTIAIATIYLLPAFPFWHFARAFGELYSFSKVEDV